MLGSTTLITSLLAVAAQVAAQSDDLAGTVGPLTSIDDKKAVATCDITDYGATADGETDISSALNDAFTACKAGGVVVIPEGDYALQEWVTMSGGDAWALQLDGTIYRTGTDGGNMIFIEHTSDFELFSSTGAGAVQGYGYEFHKEGSYGARILRFYEVSNFSVHDVTLVDAPAFHFSMDTCESGEVYNMLIRGGNMGGLDGIDVWSNNIWIREPEFLIKMKNKADYAQTTSWSPTRTSASQSSLHPPISLSRISIAIGLEVARWALWVPMSMSARSRTRTSTLGARIRCTW